MSKNKYTNGLLGLSIETMGERDSCNVCCIHYCLPSIALSPRLTMHFTNVISKKLNPDENTIKYTVTFNIKQITCQYITISMHHA